MKLKGQKSPQDKWLKMSKGNNVKLLGIFLLLATILLGCGSASPVSKNIENYTGPEITKVVVDKSQRKIFLLNNKKIIRKIKIGLGFAPQNHKIKQGDGRTPEGLYFIDRKNYNSKYFLSMGISYPNANDTRNAKKLGVDPGGDIFIHGGPRYKGEYGKKDWTAGCISVSDKNIRTIYSMVKTGTPILIKP